MPIEKQRILGSSEIWHQVLVQVSQVAPLNRPVLIVGERGTGKELIAERLHYLSSRWQQSYLQVNCAVITSYSIHYTKLYEKHIHFAFLHYLCFYGSLLASC